LSSSIYAQIQHCIDISGGEGIKFQVNWVPLSSPFCRGRTGQLHSWIKLD